MADEKLINAHQKHDVKVTTCKTVTNTRIEQDRHGVIRREVTQEIKQGGGK